jgi:hypothetical protein
MQKDSNGTPKCPYSPAVCYVVDIPVYKASTSDAELREIQRTIPHALTLQGAGLLRNITGCHISSPELQAYPEWHGITYTKLEAPTIYLPDNISVLKDHERELIKDIPLPNLQRLSDIQAHITVTRNTYDVDAILHVHQSSLLLEKQTNWFIIPFTTLSTLLSLTALVYLVYTHFRKAYYVTGETDAATSTLIPPLEPSTQNDEEPNIIFTSYSMRQ